MKKIFLICVLVAATASSFAQANDSTVTFTGNVTGDNKGFNKIFYYSSGTKVDSAAIVDGKFRITAPFKETYVQLFYTQYEAKTRGGYRPFPVLVDKPGTITIDMNIADGLFGAKLGGEPTAVAYNSFSAQQNAAFVKLNEAVTRYRDSLSKKLIAPLIMDFVKKNPNSYAGVYVLTGAAKAYLDVKQFKKAFNYLSAEMKDSREGGRVAAYITGLENAAVGKKVKYFVLNDPEDKPLNFEQYKGKYVWVDFWASWCGPCKQAFPRMKEMYAKYKGDKFEIVGISTDATKEPWLKAVNEFKNPWPQMWDNKTVADQFAVKAYPTSFLIDPDGKIILIEVGYEPNGAMEQKLTQIFGRKAM